LARNGLDYVFFQLLSEKIDKANGEEKEHLTKLREHLLTLTRELDAEVQKRLDSAMKLVEELSQTEDVENALQSRLNEVDDFFSQALQISFEDARKKGDMSRIDHLQKLIKAVEKASAPPPEIELIQKLLQLENEEQRMDLIKQNDALITPEFLQSLNGIIMDSQNRNQPQDLIDGLKEVHRSVLKYSMQKNIAG
jgi:hypothetical protein